MSRSVAGAGAELPPKPDKDTGHPRPPRAPDLPGWTEKAGSRDQADLGKSDSPPSGRGRVLEWFRESRRMRVQIAAFHVLVTTVLFVFLGLAAGSIGPELILGILVGMALVSYLSSGGKCSAGADWYMVGQRFVDTYELTSVKVGRAVSEVSRDLVMKDSSGRKVRTTLGSLQKNPLLWDLVYNGIRHSVRNGASTNRDARLYLEL